MKNIGVVVAGMIAALGSIVAAASAQTAAPAVAYEVLSEIGPHGSSAYGGVVVASDGNYYGTTNGGGRHGRGVIYRVTPGGELTVVHHFTGGAGGANPYGELVEAADGRLYGTTWSGGNEFNWGTVFSFAPASGTFAVLDASYEAGNCYAISRPVGGLAKAMDGTMYGISNGLACGTPIFQVTLDGVVVPVPIPPTTPVPGSAANAGLLIGSDGALYGTFANGGGVGASGVVFRFRPGVGFTRLHTFGRGPDPALLYPDGSGPAGGLAEGVDGSIYGTTMSGGSADNDGVVFRIAPDGAFSVVHRFGPATGGVTRSGLVRGSDGAIYGTSQTGGAFGAGTIFRVTPEGDFELLHSFRHLEGNSPLGGLAELPETPGTFIGTTSSGGVNQRGVVFRLGVRNADTTAPVLTVPDDRIVYADDAAGAVVEYTVTATDDTDPDPVVLCSPPSNTLFPIVVTTVHCTARDASGNESTASFTIDVRDGRGVQWTLDYPSLVEATGPAGAIVNYNVRVSGAVPPDPVISCLRASGTTFPVGPNQVTCTTLDANGALATASFVIMVSDTTPPSLTVPAPFELDPTTTNFKLVYSVAATDIVDRAPIVSCSPVAGTGVIWGDRVTVRCTARDASGNTSNASFTVTVLTYDDVLERMARRIEAYNLPPGITISITYKLRGASQELRRSGKVICPHIVSAEREINALAGNKIPIADAREMMQTLSTIFTTQGCWNSYVLMPRR